MKGSLLGLMACSAICCCILLPIWGVWAGGISTDVKNKTAWCKKVTTLAPGFYELNDVWLVESTAVAVIRPIRIDGEDTTNLVVLSTPLSHEWILCDVTGYNLFAKKYKTSTNPFTDIVQIKEDNGVKTIVPYLSFLKK